MVTPIRFFSDGLFLATSSGVPINSSTDRMSPVAPRLRWDRNNHFSMDRSLFSPVLTFFDQSASSPRWLINNIKSNQINSRDRRWWCLVYDGLWPKGIWRGLLPIIRWGGRNPSRWMIHLVIEPCHKKPPKERFARKMGECTISYGSVLLLLCYQYICIKK